MADKRLLIVDDDRDYGDLVRRAAEPIGYTVEVTSDGVAFMEAFERFRPCVVFIDIVMPGVDGTELVRWLARTRTDVRVVLATGYTPEYGRITNTLAEAHGICDVRSLTKPITHTSLLAALAD